MLLSNILNINLKDIHRLLRAVTVIPEHQISVDIKLANCNLYEITECMLFGVKTLNSKTYSHFYLWLPWKQF